VTPTLDEIKRDRNALCNVLGLPSDKRGAHRCTLPGHEDKNASLSIHQNEAGAWRFKCHGCNRGGSIIDAVMFMRGVDKTTAIGLLRGATPATSTATTTTSPKPSTTATTKEPKPEPARNIEAEVQEAKDYREALFFAPAALDYLWRRRGISAAVAQAHGLGVTGLERDADGQVVGAVWTMPVFGPDGNTWIGCKLHRDPPRPGQSKAGWLVKGGTGLYPRPETQSLRPGDEIVVCEGELKALAFVSAGVAATSLTTGASAGWRPEIAERLRGFKVILDPDREDSEAARVFVKNAVEALASVAAFVRVAGGAEQ